MFEVNYKIHLFTHLDCFQKLEECIAKENMKCITEDGWAVNAIKLKAAQELSENFELITQCNGFQGFLEHSMKIFIRILQEGEPQFLSENNVQQMRKLILEMIHRLPTSEILHPYVNSILTLMLKLLQVDNEENVLVCLRIIIELHKQYRPAFSQDVRMWNTVH